MRAVTLAWCTTLALALALGSAACGGGEVGDGPGDGDPDGDVDDPPADAAADAAIDVDPDAATPPPDARACVAGDARITDPLSGTCYVYVLDAVPWSEARAACEALGGHLATSTGIAEVALLAALVIDPDLEPDSWLGGTDAASEDNFLWITGEPFVFENWRTGEPNDNDGAGGGEDCMVLEADNGGLWDDRSCASDFPYFCELP